MPHFQYNGVDSDKEFLLLNMKIIFQVTIVLDHGNS